MARLAACLIAAAAALLLMPLPAAADLILGPVTRTALKGCDNPTPVRGPGGAIFSNVSDCEVGESTRISTGWAKIDPNVEWVPSNLTAYGNGAKGPKLSGALVEGGTLYLLVRNITRRGGMQVGQSASIDEPIVTWTGKLDFGWGSFAQASPDGYQYIYLRDSKTAYGKADDVVLARVPKGEVANLAAWEVFSGTAADPAWVPWSKRAARQPVLHDPGRIKRVHVSHLKGCWMMAVTMPPPGHARGGSGLAVYTAFEAYGPWTRQYYVTGANLGESAQFSPLYRGTLLLTRKDRFEWRKYSLRGGC